jgi:hypothetical protein
MHDSHETDSESFNPALLVEQEIGNAPATGGALVKKKKYTTDIPTATLMANSISHTIIVFALEKCQRW